MVFFKRTFAILSLLSVSVISSFAFEQRLDESFQGKQIDWITKVENSGKKINQYETANRTSMAVLNDGFNDRLFVWGSNDQSQFADPDTSKESSQPIEIELGLNETFEIKEIAMSAYNVGAIINDGSQDHLYVWGGNSVGQLGIDSIGGIFSTPVEVIFDNQNDFTMRDLRLGSRTFGIVANDGLQDHLYMWGWNNSGQLGNGTYDDAIVPTEINVDGGAFGIQGKITQFDTVFSNNSAVVINKDGRDHLYMWGRNFDYESGGATTGEILTPQEVNLDGGSIGIDGTISHLSLGREFSGVSVHTEFGDHLYMWGENSSGQLGNETYSPVDSPEEINPDGGAAGIQGEVTHLSLGDSHSGVVIKSTDGKERLYMWGASDFGQLGNNTTDERNSDPVEINIGGAVNGIQGEVKDLSLSQANSGIVVATANGDKLYTWGSNSAGQIGNGLSGTDVLTPGNINLLNYVVTIPFIETLEVTGESDKSAIINWNVIDVDDVIISIKVVDSSEVIYDMGVQKSGTEVISGLEADTIYSDWKLEVEWGNESIGYKTTSAKIGEFNTSLLSNKLLFLILIPIILLFFLIILLIIFIARRGGKKVEYNVFGQLPPDFQQPYEGNYIGTNYGQDLYLEANNDTSEITLDYQEPEYDYYEPTNEMDYYEDYYEDY